MVSGTFLGPSPLFGRHFKPETRNHTLRKAHGTKRSPFGNGDAHLFQFVGFFRSVQPRGIVVREINREFGEHFLLLRHVPRNCAMQKAPEGALCLLRGREFSSSAPAARGLARRSSRASHPHFIASRARVACNSRLPVIQSKEKSRHKAGFSLCLLRGRELHPRLEVMSLPSYYYSTPLYILYTMLSDFPIALPLQSSYYSTPLYLDPLHCTSLFRYRKFR